MRIDCYTLIWFRTHYPKYGTLIYWIFWSEVKLLSRVQFFATPWTVAHQAPPSMEFSRQEYWSGLPFPSPGDLPNPGIEPSSPTLWADALLSSQPPGSILSWRNSKNGKCGIPVPFPLKQFIETAGAGRILCRPLPILKQIIRPSCEWCPLYTWKKGAALSSRQGMLLNVSELRRTCWVSPSLPPLSSFFFVLPHFSRTSHSSSNLV